MEWLSNPYVQMGLAAAYLLLEMWLGETSKVDANSTLKAVWNAVKKLWPGSSKPKLYDK